jgi:hypothetical protein
VLHHASELVNKKGPESFSDSFLPEKNGARGIQLNEQSYDEENRREHEQPQNGSDDIE